MAEEPGVASVERAIGLLACFRDGEAALPLRELAARSGLTKSTVLRLMASLERLRCAERRPGGAWALGPMLFRLGMLYARGDSLHAHVPQALAALAASTGESASFWVRDGESRLCLFRADSPQAVRDHVRAGDRFPLAQGASGRALLRWGAGRAAGPPEVLSSDGERAPEVAALAAPVFGPGGRLLGALSLSGPRGRVLPALDPLRAALLPAAAALTAALGGDLGGSP